MAGLSRSSIGRLAVSGYPGHIFVCKLRYGYGHQEHIEKLEILHNWYSDLVAYLPEMFETKKEEYNKTFAPLITDVAIEIDAAYLMYDSIFEGQSCDPKEKDFIKVLRGIKERLDTITAKSKIIEGMKADNAEEMLAG
jgi:hypothetical protein